MRLQQSRTRSTILALLPAINVTSNVNVRTSGQGRVRPAEARR